MTSTLTPCLDSNNNPCVQDVDEDGKVSICDLDGEVYDCPEWTAVGPAVKRGDDSDLFWDVALVAARAAVARSPLGAAVAESCATWAPLPSRPTASIKIVDGLPAEVLLSEGDEDNDLAGHLETGDDLSDAIADACGLSRGHFWIDESSWSAADGGPEAHARIEMLPAR